MQIYAFVFCIISWH